MTKANWLISVCVLSMQAGLAYAQDTAQTQAGTEDDMIIVTATRRAEALSDVPIAVSAVTSEQLQNSGASDIRALNQLAPSLLVSGATSEVNFTARIRGIGTVGENAGIESSVALFIDGVYRSRTGVGLTELGEIERIEVLRGPQGTLFGRNASAGLLNIVTKKPSFETEGTAAATYGNYDYLRLEGSVTGPILGDSVAARLDGVYIQRDGFIKDVVSGRSVNDRDRYMVRGQLLFEPQDDLSIRVIGDYSARDEECCGAVYMQPIRNLSRNSSGAVVESPSTTFALMQALGAQIQTDPHSFPRTMSITPGRGYRSDSKDWGVSAEVNWDLGAANLTSITAYRDYKNAQGQDSDFNAVDVWARTDLDRHFQTFTQELRLQGTAFDDRLDWLVGGYYAKEKLTVDDDIKYGADYEKFANCLVMASVLPSALLPTDPFCINLPVLNAAATLSGSPVLNALRANPLRPGLGSLAAALGQPGLAINGTGVVRNFFEQDSRNYALFTHNVFDIIRDKLSLTLGARYTNEKKELETAFNANNTLCALLRASPLQALQGPACVINGTAGPGFSSSDPGSSRKESEWSGTAVLSFKPVDEVLLYASYSKGYKAGGYNLDTSALDPLCSATFDTGTPSTGIPSCATRLALAANLPGNGRPELADLQFEAEKVDAYELGVKWDGPGININTALFYQAFRNFQLNTFNGINFEVTNIAACKDDLAGGDTDNNFSTGACDSSRTKAGVISKGVEIEASVNPAPFLNFSGGFTYAKTAYRKNLVGTDGRPLSPALFQLPGRQISNAPKYVLTGSMSWSPPIGGNGMSGLLYLDFRYQGDVNTGSDLDIEKVQDAFAVVNGRVGLFGADRRWGIELWGQNLFNRKYQQIAADAPLQGGGTYRGVATGVSASANPLFVAFPGEPRTYGVTVRTRF